MPSPHPQALCDRARRLMEVHGYYATSEITGLSRATLWKWKKRGWKAADHTCPPRPRPTDFAIQVRHMSYADLVKHYRTSTACIARWKRELGLPTATRKSRGAPCIGRRG